MIKTIPSVASLKKQGGFTITELLIAIGLSTIISVAMLSLVLFYYGALVREQTRASMIMESQLFLRRLVEDVRVASEIRTSNSVVDPSKADGWTTSDPANILILTSLATDSSKDFIYDATTGYPYENEIVYFGSDRTMYRRTLSNSAATGNAATTTCAAATASCPSDIELAQNLSNMTFTFYDIDNAVTTTPENAQSVSITVNLSKKIFGKNITITNVARTTLRNEN